MPNHTVVTLLQPQNAADVAQTAKLLDDMSQYHTDNVPEVFDEHRIPKTPEYVTRLLNDGAQIWIAKDGDSVVGVLQGIIRTSEENPGWRVRTYGQLDALFVVESHRGQKVGDALMQTAHDYFKDQGVKVVEANIWGFNIASQKLAQRMGYEAKNTNVWRHL